MTILFHSLPCQRKVKECASGKQCGKCPKAMRPARQLSDIPEPHTISLRSSTPPPTAVAISEQLGSCKNGCEMYREKKGHSETPLNGKAAAYQPGNTVQLARLFIVITRASATSASQGAGNRPKLVQTLLEMAGGQR
ncbi:unnamed protein product [Gulo gulo]|uniref:Uncharacterized protein n=1 Tax=Gulo gulo TaxID=48420 RepID=A0A9X9Q1K4_GULGU|nr:unnamed protein product [Gulo gulo]